MKTKTLITVSLVLMMMFLEVSCQKSQETKTAGSSEKQESLWSSSQTESRESGGGPNRLRYGRRWRLEKSGPVRLSGKEKEVVKIETARVDYRSIKSQVTANGKIIAPINRMAVVSYAFPARVNEIIVKVGEWVEKGAPLLTLQSEEAGKSRAEFFRALADLELAQANFERQKKLYERGAGAQKDYLAAEAELKVARANLEAAEKKLHLLGFSEQEVQQMMASHQINPIVTVYSPIKGKVVEIKVIPGETVDQSKDIMTIIDPRVLCVDAEIFEKDLARIKLGQKVEITVPAFPDKTFYGKVSYIGDVLKEDTRTITVRTEVNNSEMFLKPGMFATLRIQLNGDRPVLAVPATAICDHLGKKFVFVVRGDEFEPRQVLLGASQDGFYEVISGLQEGELVATSGSFQLKSKLLSEVLKESIHD